MRNFLQIDAELQDRIFLVGPIASGKSNLLDVFRFLYDIVCIGGGFQEAIRKRGGVSSLRCLAAQRYSNILIHVDIGNEEDLSAWEYEIHFNQDNLRRPIIKKDDEALINRLGEHLNIFISQVYGKKGKNFLIREDMIPRPESGHKVGPAYTSRLSNFIEDIQNGWRPDGAIQFSDRLNRCIRSIKRFMVKST